MRAAWLAAAAVLLAACQQEPVSPPVLKITERAEAPNPNAGLSSEAFIGSGPRVEVTGCDLFTLRDGLIAVKNSYRKNRLPR